jgi:microcystin-dependent protein
MAKSRRSYKGAAVSNSISSSGLPVGTSSPAVGLTISLSQDMSGWSETGIPFFAVIDPGTSKEEKVCVIYASPSTLTVVDPAVTSGWTASVNGRGVDGTINRAHDSGAAIYPVFTATEADQANELVSKYTINGDIVVHGQTGLKTIGISGTSNNNKVLVADSTVADGGVKWAQITADGIADSAITSGKILDGAIVNADINASAAIALSKLATGALPTAITVASANLVDGTIVNADINASAAIELSKLATGALPTDITVSSANLVNGTVALADLATAVANALVPVGTITAYAGVTAPTGWLLCNGTSTTGYTALTALVGATTPDFRGRFLIGDNDSLTLLGTGGSTTIATTNLPAHSHAAGTLVNGASATGVTTQNGGTHDHTVSLDLLTSTTSHGHGQNGVAMGGTTADPDGDGSMSTSSHNGHAHTITDPTHTHTITGSTAETGGAQAYYPPYGVVNYIIKHD